MHNVFKGIVVGVLGFVLWLVASFVGGAITGLGGPALPVLFLGMYLGFFVMVGGPVVYIVVLPVAGWIKRRRARHEVRASPASP